MKDDGKILTKPEKLAQIIYEAVIRYTKAKETQIRREKANSELDFSFIQRGNSTREIDLLENKGAARKRK